MPHHRRSIWNASLFLGICLFLPATMTAHPTEGVIENRGQIEDEVLFYSVGGGIDFYFTRTGIVLDFPRQRQAVVMRFLEAKETPSVEPIGERATRLNFFPGRDPARWKSGVPVFDAICYRNLWEGVNLRFQPSTGRLCYEIEAHTEAAVGRVRFDFEGIVRKVELPDGTNRIDLPVGFLFDSPEDRDGKKRILWWSDEAIAADEDPGLDREDPTTLLWSTFLGGSNNEYSHGLVLDSAGNPVVAGYTSSGNFPATAGAYDGTWHGSYDVFVAKFDATGSTLSWATYVGGELEDRAFGVVLDQSEDPVVAGLTYSTDFPTTPWAYTQELVGLRDGFVLKLSSTGGSLIWSTYLGGSYNDRIWDLGIDDQDQPIVVGQTYSADFPVTEGAFDTEVNGLPDAFVTKLAANGADLVWSTFIGGSVSEQLTQVVIGPEQQIAACGNSISSNYPTTEGAFDQTHNGGQDCIVSVLDPSGSTLLLSTFLGGAQEDMGNVIDMDVDGSVVVTGSTLSTNYPVTPGAYDTSYNGNRDIFITRLTPDGRDASWSSYLGGSDVDEPFAMVLHASGFPILSGGIASSDFPTTGDAYDQTYGGNSDAFLTAFHPSGQELLWSSYLGGTETDAGWELFLDLSGNPILAGPTRSSDFPTTPGAYDRTHNGSNDVFVLSIDLRRIVAADERIDSPPMMWVGPNPFRRTIEVRLDSSPSVEQEVLVLDASGRIVASLADGLRRSGASSVSWDGRDRLGRQVAAGVYWLRVGSGRSSRSQKIIHLR